MSLKYAFMSFSCPTLTLDEMLALAKRLGYDGIEPRIDSGHAHGVELSASASSRATLRQKAIDSGIALCCVATSCRFADPAAVNEEIGVARRAIDLAADVGAPRLRVFGGQIPGGTRREEAITVAGDALRSLADHASQRGVTVCLETHDDWTHPAHVAALMQRANHPNIAVNWDIMHPVRQSNVTMDEAYAALKPWIRHVHFHDGVTVDGQLKLAPVGQGNIDHRRAVQLLRDAGYDGFLSGEWIDWEPYATHLPRELATMKGYENPE